MAPLVIHIFAPLITQSLPRRFAWVFMFAGSEPPCGSVRPKQPISSPLRHARQVFLLLRFAAEGVDRIHAERGLHGHEAADAGIPALELLADEPVAHRVQPGAAVAFDGGAEQAERGELRHQVLRESDAPRSTSG